MRIMNMLEGERTVRISSAPIGATVTAKINDIVVALRGAPVTVPGSGEANLEFTGALFAAGDHLEITALPTTGAKEVSDINVLAKPAPAPAVVAPVVVPPAGPILPLPTPAANNWLTAPAAAVLVTFLAVMAIVPIAIFSGHTLAPATAIPAVSATAPPALSPAGTVVKTMNAAATAIEDYERTQTAAAASAAAEKKAYDDGLAAFVKRLTRNSICGKLACEKTGADPSTHGH